MMNRLIRNLMKGWDLGRIVRMLSGLLLSLVMDFMLPIRSLSLSA